MPGSTQTIISSLSSQPTPIKTKKRVFIHGTNSSCLPLMARTKFKMLSALELLDEYNLVPYSGELMGGGLGDPYLCLPCFGSLKSRERKYNLERIIDNYTNPYSKTDPKKLKDTLIEKYSGVKENHFFKINEILILLAKIQQQGEKIPINIEPNLLKSTINLFYLYLILNDHLEPTPISWLKHVLNWVDYSELMNYGFNYFSTENMYSKLNDIEFDMEEIYKNPTTENLEKVVEFLSLPGDSNLNRPKFSYVRLPKIPNFIRKILDKIYVFIMSFSEKQHLYAKDDWYNILENFRGHTFADNIRDYTFSNFRFDFMREKLIEHIKVLKDRLNLLNRLITDPLTPAALDETDHQLLELSFPVLFIHDKDKKIKLISRGCGEYRLRPGSSLTLGEDITTVATNNEENRKRLHDYFSSKGLRIEVILNDKLFELRDELSPPLPLSTIEETISPAVSNLIWEQAFDQDDDELTDDNQPGFLCC